MMFKPKLNTRAVILITIIIAVIMFTSSIVELNQSKKEIYQLLYEHSESLIESLIQSSSNTLNSSFEIESLITEKLFDNARLIRKLDSINVLTREQLIRIARMNNLFRINVFDKRGERILSNRVPEPGHIHGEENINRYDEIEPILTGQTDELIIGLKNAEFSDEERFAVAVARPFNRGAIVVNINAESFLEFRKKIGIGIILQQMTGEHGIEYIVLQDSVGILAASERIDTIGSISGSGFLEQALEKDVTYARVIEFSGTEIYEVVRRFTLENEIIGIYRMGVSLEDIRRVEDRMLRRLIFISVILAAVSIIVLSIIFTTQNLRAVSDEYKKFRTLASSVLENMSEAVVVADKNKIITLINKSAGVFLGIDTEKIIGTGLLDLEDNILGLRQEDFTPDNDRAQYYEKELVINGVKKYLLLGISFITGETDQPENYIIVIKDLTEIKNLEEEARRNEKLTAMGELASGIAHEIRNPVNAIGMIAQRLNREFTPPVNQEEYSGLTGVLKNEVERINRIITQFLNYARPLELKKEKVSLGKFFGEIRYLFDEPAKHKKINFIIQGDESLHGFFDIDLMKQSLMNIIRNAVDAVDEGGTITVGYEVFQNELLINVKDDGEGIPEDIQKRIFDLYFTTKKEGNGLGLSISQKIITRHNGSVRMTSSVNKGTTFKIILPLP